MKGVNSPTFLELLLMYAVIAVAVFIGFVTHDHLTEETDEVHAFDDRIDDGGLRWRR